MATVAEMRAALRAAGDPIGDRGKISGAQKARAQQLIDGWAAEAAAADAYSEGTGPDDFAPDDPDAGWLAADVPPGAALDSGVPVGVPDPGDGPVQSSGVPAGPADPGGNDRDDYGGGVTAEQRPRHVGRRGGSTGGGAGAAAGRARQLWAGLGKRGQKRSKQAKARARARAKARAAASGGSRLSGAPVIEHVLSQLAWAARAVPPVQKVLAMQATTSGVLLDQAAAGTVLDIPLQFAARQEERAEIINGTLGPAAWVAAITFLGGAQTTPGPGGQPVVLLDADGVPVWDQRTRLMIGGLRLSLMSYRKICQRSAAELQAAAEEAAATSAEADDLIKFFFATPEPGETPHDRERAAEQAGARFTGQPAPYQPPAGTAVMVPFAGVAQDDLTAAMEAAARGAAAPFPATGAHGGS